MVLSDEKSEYFSVFIICSGHLKLWTLWVKTNINIYSAAAVLILPSYIYFTDILLSSWDLQQAVSGASEETQQNQDGSLGPVREADWNQWDSEVQLE